MSNREIANRWTATICEDTCRVCQKRFGHDLYALVLTGSMAREESTFVQEGANWKLLGDADFFLVLQDGCRAPSAAAVEAAAREVKQRLAASGLIASVGLGPVHPAYFRKLPRHIATYELHCSGRVIWGPPGVLAAIPRFEPEQIEHEDAWRMLANRTIEMLESWTADEASEESLYRTIKLFLDMATSYLVFAGEYRPSYRERVDQLARLATGKATAESVPFDLTRFALRVQECTRVKLDAGCEPVDAQALRQDALQFAQLLWRWELQQLTGETRALTDSELMSQWMARQPLRARFRGWISALRKAGCLHSWRNWPRWARLCWRGSPRYRIYDVAARLLFEHDQPIARRTGAAHLIAQMPLASRSIVQHSSLAWEQVARFVADNYHRLLESTTT